MKNKIIEIGKNLLIVLLMCGVILLSVLCIPTTSLVNIPWLSRLLQPLAPLFGISEAELTYVAQAEPVPDAAQPIAISINNDVGRYTAMWDFASLDDTFSAFSPVLAQSINAAGNFYQVSEQQVQAALSGQSVYFRYGSALPADAIASWLDSELHAAVEDVYGCILAAQDGTISLYFLGETSYASQTDLPDQLLMPLLQAYLPDGSAFAFEADQPLTPLSLLPGSTPSTPVFQFFNPCDSRFINSLATALGFNPYAETRYIDDHGTDCFSETNSSLEITSSGHLLLQSEGTRFAASGTDTEVLVAAARRIMDTIYGDVSSEGRLYLSGVTKAADATVCEFEYVLGGVAVKLSEPAASVRFTGSAVTEVSAQLYAFSATGKTQYPLPVPQAIRVLEDGAPLELAFFPSADGTMTAGWIQ